MFMRVGQLKSRMPHPLSLLLLLPLICHGQIPTDYGSMRSNPLPTAYIPVGVGFTPDLTNLKDGFGTFGAYIGNQNYNAETYVTCGKKQTNYLNPQMVDSAGAGVHVVCEPSPDRVIVTLDGSPAIYKQWKRDLKQECEMFTCSSEDYPAAGTQIGVMDVKAYYEYNGSPTPSKPPMLVDEKDVKVMSADPEKPETNVCKNKKAGYSSGQATGSVLFANEGKCYKTYEDLSAKIEESGTFIQVPRWLKPGEKVRNKRSSFYHGEHAPASGTRTPYNFQSITSMDGMNYKDCLTACDVGSVVKYSMHPYAYQMTIRMDTRKCTAFRICIAPESHSDDSVVPKCDPQKIIDVNVQSGIVTWPNTGRSSLIELDHPHRDKAYPLAIEFGYGIDINGKQQAEYYIGNDHREIVSSDSLGFSAEDSTKLAFFFPTEDCLAPRAGIFSKNIQHGRTLTRSQSVTMGAPYNQTSKIPITAPQAEVVTTTTTIAPVNLPLTTTQAAPRAIPDAAALVGGKDVFETNAFSKALYVEGKWWTWGIYIGFVIGTLLTLGIGAGLFYALRRTVFAIWYRGMYKRYGCDASGTTGGITGVGFGNTVTGDVTVQGTTGGTTAGASVMGTTGTTGGTTATSTETSTLLDKTGGGEQKSLAM
ncbi:hypothetical protein L5515_002133 [Caenorhabditis briggsae]|uniref:Glycoprotein n=1 Tax=Caenorhabditis briggsae TaxID=6238 RepID=A0AAE9E7W7_CAEBR|nr:hypothetical protein L5515_002133 [Caenorhabditis briggsae]